jgi:hypothetical protein
LVPSSGEPSIQTFPAYTLTGIQVLDRATLFIRGTLRELDEAGERHTFVARYSDGTWGNYMVWAGITAQVLQADAPWRMFSLCTDGTIHIKSPGSEILESIDSSEKGPSDRVWMLDLRNIAGCLYAAGMNRLAYRREGPDRWTAIGEGAEVVDPDEVGCGFRSIDGYSADLLWAVGFRGEIWHRNGKYWSRLDSPTNVRLDRIRAASWGEIFASGAAGTVLRGDGDRWQPVFQHATDRAISTIEIFEEKVYFADCEQLFVLEADTLVPVPIPTDPPIRPCYIDVRNGVLGAVGRGSLGLFNGAEWRSIPLP